MIKEIFRAIPKIPLSALVFYITVVVLWKLGYIPSPANILLFLERLYDSYGLIGLFIASFLEGIVYFGLYFPGSLIISFAVILSDGTFQSLLLISIVVAIALTTTSLINYTLGRKILSNKLNKELLLEKKSVFSKGLFTSMLHPNLLALHFFNSGIKRQNILKVLFVPFIMIPYGLGLGYFFYFIKDSLKRTIGIPYVMISILLCWMILALILKIRDRLKQ